MSDSSRSRFWEKAAPPMRVVGAILLAAGMIHLYADKVVFDAPTFGSRAADSLGDPRVSGFVARGIADQVIARDRDLLAFRPVLVSTADAVVRSEAFRAGFRRAAQGAHAAVFSDSVGKVALSIPDVGVLVRSALAHDPALAAHVPSDLDAEVSVQPVGRVAQVLADLARLGHRFRKNAFWAIGSGILLLVLGIGLPHNRRKALLSGGATLAAVALVVFFLPPLTRIVLTASIPNEDLRPVVAGVWDAFSGGLRHWALLLAGAGIVLAAAASSFASHVEVGGVGRRAWTWLKSPARSWQGEIVRAAVLTGIGLHAVLRPAATLRGLTVVVGAVLAFEGLRELFLLVPPRIRAAADHAEDALAEAREDADELHGARTWLRAALVGLLVVVLIGAAAVLMRSPAVVPEAPALTDACNGDRALCERRLDEVALPGAHNSMSGAEIDGWMFPNQELESVSLLGHGIRALLFDVHYGTPIGDRVKTDVKDEEAFRAAMEKALGTEGFDAAMRIRERLTGDPTGPRGTYLCHGSCELGAAPLVTMLEGVRDFLVQNPGEVLVFVIEDYVVPADIEAAFRDSGLERLVYRGAVTAPFPTLREMIDSDQRLVVFGENDTGGVAWYHPAFETIQETPYTFRTPEEFSCRANRGGPDAPLFQINHWIETTPTPKPSNAEIVNQKEFLLARARQCQEERGMLPNIVAVDFAMTGDVVGVVAELNGRQ
ncbi:MAG: hypothetical protein LJF30_00290 [Acidobacteria bacterium]|jgi:hypothetical protein|nr:hypothetical protein [Acidobacteriota bacterium]